MKKTFLILLFIPQFFFAQNTNFTQEQEDVVENVVEELLNNKENISYEEETLESVQKALEEVPYHPELVWRLLDIHLGYFKDPKFVSNYCQQLSDEYLAQNQYILCAYCMASFVFNTEAELIKNRIYLIENEDIKNFYQATYFYHLDQWDEFIEYASKVINHEVFEKVNFKHEIPFIKYISDKVFRELVAHLVTTKETDILANIIETNQDAIASKKMDFDIFFTVTNVAISNDILNLSETLLNNSFANYPSEYKYVSILKAYLASEKGDETSAVIHLERSLLLDDSVFEVILNESIKNSGEINTFPAYIRTLENLTDYKTKERIVNDMLDFFEGRLRFTLQTKLYQSMLYASQDLQKAQDTLDACQADVNTQTYDFFQQLIQIESALHQEEADYNYVNQLLSYFEEKLSEEDYLMLKFDFQYGVNQLKNDEYFDAKLMIEDLNRLIELTSSEEKKLRYTITKIKILAITDVDQANEELDQLGLVNSEKLDLFGREVFTETSEEFKPTSKQKSKSKKGIKDFEVLHELFINALSGVKALY